MVLILPESPAPANVTKVVHDYGRVISGSLGGNDTRLDRPGTRYGLRVDMPPIRGPEANAFVSDLIRGKSEGVRMEWPLGEIDVGALGYTPQVQGGQAGSLLRITNWANAYEIQKGQFFSIDHDGQHYLYHATQAVSVVNPNTSTVVEVPIYPMLRRPTIQFSNCYFLKPMIEGYIQGDERAWEQAVSHELGMSFEIKEKG